MTEKSQEELDKQRQEDEDFDKDIDRRIKKAVRKEIERHHKEGRATTHSDRKGIYERHPDGRKVYTKIYKHDGTDGHIWDLLGVDANKSKGKSLSKNETSKLLGLQNAADIALSLKIHKQKS